jgi:NAD(P)-dependent dehydrogenase (short-subunit alcohol dehydrogenase family)
VTARELARHDANVVLACRDTAKGERALLQIRATAPDARLQVSELDLGELASIESFAGRMRSEYGEGGLDLLINNASVMAPPRRETSDGFELQLGAARHQPSRALRAHPRLVTPNGAARDERVAARLWEVSEELTGVRFAV